jgi:hypothetical protein
MKPHTRVIVILLVVTGCVALVWIADRLHLEQPRTWTHVISQDNTEVFTFTYDSEAACNADLPRREAEHPHPTLIGPGSCELRPSEELPPCVDGGTNPHCEHATTHLN